MRGADSFSTAVRVVAALALAYALAISVLYLTGRYPRHRVESVWLISAGLLLLKLLLFAPRAIREDAGDRGRPDRRLLLLFMLAAVLLYLPSVAVGRLSDDFVLLKAAADWRIVPSEWEHVRPLPMAIWSALASIGLSTPWVLHLLNILVHGANSFLCYRLARELGGPPAIAAAAGVLFLTYPGAVETVTWIAGLPDLVMTGFVLAFLTAALRHKHIAALIWLVLGTFSKETAVAAPILLALLHVVRPVSRRFILASLSWCVAFAIIRLYVSPAAGLLQVPDRYLAKEFLVRIYGTLALPWTRPQMQAMPAVMIAGLTAIVALLGAGAAMRTRGQDRHLLSFSAWPIIAAAPVYAFLYVAPDLQGSRHLYLPAAGWGFMLAWLASDCRPFVCRTALALLVVSGAAGVLLQQQRWRAGAEFRDGVLIAAREAAEQLDCDRPWFRTGPDTLEGVYIFRNGLNEAVGELIPTGTEDASGCRLEWSNGRFIAVE